MKKQHLQQTKDEEIQVSLPPYEYTMFPIYPFFAPSYFPVFNPAFAPVLPTWPDANMCPSTAAPRFLPIRAEDNTATSVSLSDLKNHLEASVRQCELRSEEETKQKVSEHSHTFKDDEKVESRLKSKEFQCKKCAKVFYRPSLLKLHLLSHYGIKIFPCHLCEKSFSYKCNLKAHMRIHTGDKPFQCTVCMRRFKQQQLLDEHASIHSDSMPFKCEECGKLFRRYSSLNMHLRVHSGEKPYVCDICEKAFASSGNLKVHKRVHVRDIQTNERPFLCPYPDCNKRFKTKCQLEEHFTCRKHQNSSQDSCAVSSL